MKHASTVKKTTVKTPVTAAPVAVSVPAAAKIKAETPLAKTTYSKEEFHKKVTEKAYELYLQRKGAPGSAEEDWAKAEKIVKAS